MFRQAASWHEGREEGRSRQGAHFGECLIEVLLSAEVDAKINVHALPPARFLTDCLLHGGLHCENSEAI